MKESFATEMLLQVSVCSSEMASAVSKLKKQML